MRREFRLSRILIGELTEVEQNSGRVKHVQLVTTGGVVQYSRLRLYL